MTLAPTLWRTCRALANRKRLGLLKRLMGTSARSVSDIARDLNMPMAMTSQYLRILNARGLLAVQRHGREVRYKAGYDPSVPSSQILLKALRSAFKASGCIRAAYDDLTAFTHPRRIALLKVLMDEGPATPEKLRQKTKISRQTLARHMKKLCRRGYVMKNDKGYCCTRPSTPLARALMSLARQN
jgi:DNA-binding transcriptional ArsR family regulator